MFYNNYLKTKNVQYKKINYASFRNGINANYDERLLPIRYSKNTYNYSYVNGALTNGLGIQSVRFCYDATDKSKTHTLNFPTDLDVLGAWIYTRYNKNMKQYEDWCIYYCSDCYMYVGFMYINAPNTKKISGLYFKSMPNVINYNLNGNDVLLIGTKEEGLYVYDSRISPYKVENAPNILSMCVHYERLFVTVDGDKRSLYFSDDLDPTNWDYTLNAGGFIQMIDDRGALNKVVSFNDYLYVFREFGIARVSAYAKQEDFYVTQLFTSSGRIYKNSISVCGDCVMFLASDGLYSFNGSSTSKIGLNIDKMFESQDNDNCVSAFYNGSYYLACKLNFNDNEKIGCEEGSYSNNALIELNLSSGELNIMRGVDIKNIQAFNNLLENKLVVCYKNGDRVKIGEIVKNGKVEDTPLKKVWRSPITDFNYSNQEKIITELSVVNKSDITVVINYDGKSKKYLLKGKDSINTIKPNLKAYEFSIDFVCENDNCYISNPQVVVGYLW